MKCLQQKTKANQEHYKENRTDVTKLCKQKKKLWLNSKIMQFMLVKEMNQRNFLRGKIF